MAHIILTGATGTAGSGILTYALSSPAVARVSILSRRPVQLANNEPKANVFIHDDYTNYPQSLIDELKGADACIWAQGKSSRGMNEDEYTTLTHDYPVAAARAFSKLGNPFVFIYVSGEGADMSKADGGGLLFARVKGRTERALLNMANETSSLKIFNVRPGAIYPEGAILADRIPTFQDTLNRWIGFALEVVWKSMATPTNMLAATSIKLATGDGAPRPAGTGIEANGRVLRNTALRELAQRT